MVQARRRKLSVRSGDIGGRRFEARDRGQAAAALRFAGLGRDLLARQAQPERHATGARVDDPAREDREPRLEVRARRVGQVEHRDRLRVATELLDQQLARARIRLPGDVPRRIARVVILEPREIIVAAARAAAGRIGRRERRRRRVRGRPRIDEAGEIGVQHGPGAKQAVGEPRRDLEAVEHDAAAPLRRHADLDRSSRRRPRRSLRRRRPAPARPRGRSAERALGSRARCGTRPV